MPTSGIDYLIDGHTGKVLKIRYTINDKENCLAYFDTEEERDIVLEEAYVRD